MSKRLFDISVSVLCLLLFAPFFLPVVLLIKLDSKGPVFFKQTRVGRYGRHFVMYRFRSLREDRRCPSVPASLLYDTRLTRMGYLMRAASIDVIPQFWNVLRGDMSIVGPRPAKVHLVDPEDSQWQRILQVRPGMVSPSFLRYGIAFMEIHDRLNADIGYLDQQSLFHDVLLIVRAFKLRSQAPLRDAQTK